MSISRAVPRRPLGLVPALLCSLLLAVSGCGTSSGSGGSGAASNASTPTATATATPTGAPSLAEVTAAPEQVAQTPMGPVGYRSVGSGPVLVLIMGFGGTLDDWTPSFVAALARTHRVITPDNSGFGSTTVLPAPLTVTAMADQTAALLGALGVDRADVLGWSLGGMIAQALTIQRPELVSHLVLAATLPGDGHATQPTAAASRRLVASVTDPSLVLSLLFPADANEAATSYVSGITAWSHAETAPLAAVGAEGTALQSWLAGDEPVGHRLASITAPTLVADGSADVLAPPGNLTTLVGAIPGAQRAVYAGAGHAFLFQDQQAFLARVARFLG